MRGHWNELRWIFLIAIITAIAILSALPATSKAFDSQQDSDVPSAWAGPYRFWDFDPDSDPDSNPDQPESVSLSPIRPSQVLQEGSSPCDASLEKTAFPQLSASERPCDHHLEARTELPRIK